MSLLMSLNSIVTPLSVNLKLLLGNWAALPFYITNAIRYSVLNRNSQFRIRFSELHYCAVDRFRKAGGVDIHYFAQDLWSAEFIFQQGNNYHVDIGSRLDGFISHLLLFSKVVYVDLRPIAIQHKNFEFKRGDITNLPFPDNSVDSLSSLHVIEHVGIGRYGDKVDPIGYEKAARELVRVLAPGGTLLLSTPVGKERLCYDAHRVFSPEAVVNLFKTLTLKEFSLITDSSINVISNASFKLANQCNYGCGLFAFGKDL